MTGHIYRDVILEQHAHLFRGAMDAEFLFMDDNAHPHRANIVDECLQSEDITHMDWPAYSPDLNPIEHVKDMLGRRIAAHQLPPTCLLELRRALLDEWHNIPQDQIDNLILSMPRRCKELWFQQDGATCHTARATIDLLKDTFRDRLISRLGPVNWPPRSCDLTPLDYFLWGYVKSLVYADNPQTLDHLEDNIRRVIADIQPQMLEKVIENWTSRLDYIRASRGSHMPEIIFKIVPVWHGGCQNIRRAEVAGIEVKAPDNIPGYFPSKLGWNSAKRHCQLHGAQSFGPQMNSMRLKIVERVELETTQHNI
ncbi:DDE_3 domain-containing protein [Trichonephila clavipes]|nr:DDE_3 domain-containing protein [Trichonephila clavipes]